MIQNYVGNESRGICSEMYDNLQYVKAKNKQINVSSVQIPLSNNIESLNCAIAFAIIGYEIKELFNI